MADQTKTTSASSRKDDEKTDVAMAASDAESSDWEIAGANDEQRDEPEQPERPEQHAAPTRRRRPAAPVLEKDAEEEDLERLVLGDNAHFRALLFASDTVDDAGVDLQDLSLAVTGGAEGEDDDDDEAATGFEEADDMHMFFQDEALQVNTSSLGTTKGAAAATTTDKDRASAFAWEDSDDERLAVSLASASRLRKLRRTEGEDIVSGAEYAARLRQQYLRLHPQPAWAAEAYKRVNRQKTTATKKKRRKSRAESGGSSSDEDGNRSGSGSGSSSDDETEDALPLDHFFRSASAMAGASRLVFTQQQHGESGKGRRLLRPEVIDIQKTRDIPTSHTGPVGTLAFHPHHPLLLSSSPSSVLHLHHIAPGAHPTPNPLLTAVRVRQTPVRRSAGIMNLYDRTALVVPDAHHTKKSKLDLDDDSNSDDSDDSDDDNFTVQATPTPARVFEQLTTPVTALAFTPDGQLLAFASQHKTDALRLVHLPSCTVYRNWPTTKTPLGRITAVAFGKDSDLLAVGNDAGKTRLWEIRG
ncbi:small nucleolar ribonucleoprotein complex [Niveomyces insectorum RCEF 264]|uniref:Small nucleolar ribonucleoprotein complex n=1 Tax=Niveomyces insectorum RCEF 264 TaxID=1081102 RepID=A0A167U351_9HYPO|nr:small nucleolar ribonucleoprotein complex [Niveomyces insectorum RCEF 264]